MAQAEHGYAHARPGANKSDTQKLEMYIREMVSLLETCQKHLHADDTSFFVIFNKAYSLLCSKLGQAFPEVERLWLKAAQQKTEANAALVSGVISCMLYVMHYHTVLSKKQQASFNTRDPYNALKSVHQSQYEYCKQIFNILDAYVSAYHGQESDEEYAVPQTVIKKMLDILGFSDTPQNYQAVETILQRFHVEAIYSSILRDNLQPQAIGISATFGVLGKAEDTEENAKRVNEGGFIRLENPTVLRRNVSADGSSPKDPDEEFVQSLKAASPSNNSYAKIIQDMYTAITRKDAYILASYCSQGVEELLFFLHLKKLHADSAETDMIIQWLEKALMAYGLQNASTPKKLYVNDLIPFLDIL